MQSSPFRAPLTAPQTAADGAELRKAIDEPRPGADLDNSMSSDADEGVDARCDAHAPADCAGADAGAHTPCSRPGIGPGPAQHYYLHCGGVSGESVAGVAATPPPLASSAPFKHATAPTPALTDASSVSLAPSTGRPTPGSARRSASRAEAARATWSQLRDDHSASDASLSSSDGEETPSPHVSFADRVASDDGQYGALRGVPTSHSPHILSVRHSATPQVGGRSRQHAAAAAGPGSAPPRHSAPAPGTAGRPLPDPSAFDSAQVAQALSFTASPPARPQCPPTPARTPAWASRHNRLRRQNSLSVTKTIFDVNDGPTAEGHKNFKFEDEFVNMGVLGKGSFSVVYQALCKSDGFEYAVKRNLEVFRSKRDRDILLDEYRVSLLIGAHPNVVRYYKAWQEDGHMYFQLDLCNRGNIQQYRERQAPALSEPVLWAFVAAMANGLKHIHAVGLVHLDIKPENALLTDKGHVKIGDLGMCHQYKVVDHAVAAPRSPPTARTAPRSQPPTTPFDVASASPVLKATPSAPHATPHVPFMSSPFVPASEAPPASTPFGSLPPSTPPPSSAPAFVVAPAPHAGQVGVARRMQFTSEEVAAAGSGSGSGSGAGAGVGAGAGTAVKSSPFGDGSNKPGATPAKTLFHVPPQRHPLLQLSAAPSVSTAPGANGLPSPIPGINTALPPMKAPEALSPVLTINLSDAAMVRDDDDDSGLEGDSRYLPPEAFQAGSKRPPYDIFSFGLSLFELVWDIRLPTTQENWTRGLLEGKFPAINPQLRRSKELVDLVKAMTAPNPADRPTAEQILALPLVRSALLRDSPLPTPLPDNRRSTFTEQRHSRAFFGRSQSMSGAPVTPLPTDGLVTPGAHGGVAAPGFSDAPTANTTNMAGSSLLAAMVAGSPAQTHSSVPIPTYAVAPPPAAPTAPPSLKRPMAPPPIRVPIVSEGGPALPIDHVPATSPAAPSAKKQAHGVRRQRALVPVPPPTEAAAPGARTPTNTPALPSWLHQ